MISPSPKKEKKGKKKKKRNGTGKYRTVDKAKESNVQPIPQ